MAERIAYLEAIVGADITQFRKGMRDIRNEVGFLSESMRGVSAIGRTMTFTLTAPLVTLATYAGQAAASFDASMRNINSIAQLSEQEFANLSDRVLEFASTTRAGVVPATDALYEIFSAGITDIDRAMAVWETSTRVAEAGLASLEKTTNAVTATMSAYGFETSEATRVGDVWTHMVALGVGSLEDFLANSQKVLPLSRALGISFEDLGASAAYVSQQGGGAKKAMTALAMLESNLLKPTEALSNAYQKLGVRTGQELITKFGSLGEAIIAIRGAAEDEVDFAKMFSKTGLEAAFAFTNNVEASTAAIEEFKRTVEGATGRAWDEQMKSFEATFDLFKTSVEALAIAVGQVLLPVITPILQSLTAWFLSVSKLNPKLIEFGVVIGAVVAAAGPLIWILGSILTPAGLLVGAIAGLALAFTTHFDTIKATVKNAVKDILGEDGFGQLTSMWETVIDTLFPEGGQAVVVQELEPLNITMNDLITVEEGDTLWSIFTEKGYDNIYSWERFKEITGLQNPGMLEVGDVIRIPSNFGSMVFDGIAQTFGVRNMRDAIELDATGLVTFSGPLDAGLEETLLDRLKAAGEIVVERAPAILTETFSRVFDHIKASIATALQGLGAQESIYDPLSGQLIPQTTGDTELFSGLRDFLVGNIASLAIQWEGIKGGLQGIGDGIKGFVDNLGTIDASKAKKALGDILTIGGALSILIGGIIAAGVRTVGRIASYTLPSLGSAIAGLVNIVGGLSTGDFKLVLSGIDQSIRGVVDAVLGIPAGLADTVIGFLEDTTNVQMDSSTAETFTTWAGIIENAAIIVGTAWENLQHRIKMAWLQISLDTTMRVQELIRTVSPISEALGLGEELQFAGVKLAITEMDIREQLAQLQIGDVVTAEINRQLASTTVSPFMENLNIETAQGSIGVMGGSFLDQVVGWVNTAELSSTQQQSVANWFNRAMATAIATGNNEQFSSLLAAKGQLDPTAIDMSLMSTGIVDGLVNGLLEEQPRVHTAMVDMATGANDALIDIWQMHSPSAVFAGYGTDLLQGLINGVNTKAPAVKTAFETQFGAKGVIMTNMNTFKSEFAVVVKAIVSEIAKITAEASKAAGAINSLESQAAVTSGDGTPRAGGGGVFPGHAYKVGDGVSPELFVPNQTGQLIPMHELRAGSRRNQSGPQNVQININGVQDVDKLLHELHKRGIKLKR